MTGEFLLRDIHHRYGAQIALRGVSFGIPRGGITGVVGDNGAGKSTLLSLLARQLRWQQGTATAPEGRPWESLRLGWLASDDLCLPNAPLRSFAHRCLGPGLGMSPDHAARRFDDLCQRLGVEALAERRPHRLSRGQRLRLALATSLLEVPDLALLDEPFLGLDPGATDRALQCIADERSAHDMTFLISDHRLELLQEICDRWVFLVRGEVARIVDAGPEGPPATLRDVYREVSGG